MKIGILGDTHFTNKTPERRKDNYWETEKRKFNQSLSIFKDLNCDLVIQTGDLFDSPTVPNSVMSEIIRILIRFDTKLYIAWGNHENRSCNRGTLDNSPLSVLQSSGVAQILGNSPVKVDQNSIYGAGFGDPIPTISSKDGEFNTLVAHKMIGDRPLYPGDEVINPNSFLRSNPKFNLVIAGHYHYRFISDFEGRVIINPGAMVRKSISKSDLEHRPAVVTFDTCNLRHEVIELEFTPSEEVFDLTRKSLTSVSDFSELIQKIKSTTREEKVGWKTRLLSVIEGRGCGQSVIDEINSSIEEALKC